MQYLFFVIPILVLIMGQVYIINADSLSVNTRPKGFVVYGYTALFSVFAGYLYYKWGITEVFVRHFIVVSLFYISVLIDIKTMELPIEYYLSFLVPAGILFVIGDSQQKYWELLYLAITAGTLFSISFFSKNAFGFGDSIFIVIMTCFLGFYLTFSLFLVALCVAGLGSLVLFVLQKVGRKTQMPFVPFLLLAYVFHLMII